MHSPWIPPQEHPGPELQPVQRGPQWGRRAGRAVPPVRTLREQGQRVEMEE